eukprot:764337-Hanusia_phi.AAC.1
MFLSSRSQASLTSSCYPVKLPPPPPPPPISVPADADACACARLNSCACLIFFPFPSTCFPPPQPGRPFSLPRCLFRCLSTKLFALVLPHSWRLLCGKFWRAHVEVGLRAHGEGARAGAGTENRRVGGEGRAACVETWKGVAKRSRGEGREKKPEGGDKREERKWNEGGGDRYHPPFSPSLLLGLPPPLVLLSFSSSPSLLMGEGEGGGGRSAG